jgi:large subunit ribosomal protein L21
MVATFQITIAPAQALVLSGPGRRGKGAHNDMFAVVETGGKQYKVSPGQTVEVEKLPALPGDTVELGQVLLISTDDQQTLIGTPTLEDAKIVARVTQIKRGPKIIVFKYKSKSRYRRKNGHRQDYTTLTIQDIWANGASLLPAEEEAEAPSPTEAGNEEAAAAEATPAEVAPAEEPEVEETKAAPEPPRRRSKKDATSSAAETEATSEESEMITTTTQKTVRTVKRTRVEIVEEDGEVTEVIEGEPEVVSETVEEKKSTRRSRKGE